MGWSEWVIGSLDVPFVHFALPKGSTIALETVVTLLESFTPVRSLKCWVMDSYPGGFRAMTLC